VWKKSLLIITLILIADQVLKFGIKTNMTLGEEINILGNWFIIHFTENEGMAFGLSFGGIFGKLALSLFRIAAITIIFFYLREIISKKYHKALIISISLILAGAIGNMLDSAFYGLIFSNSSYTTVAKLFPPEGGYGSFLHGKVVDMLYFPIIQSEYPAWVPIVGGDDFIFFRPVFNIADSSITIGVFILIIFQGKIFRKNKPTESETLQIEEDENLNTESDSSNPI